MRKENEESDQQAGISGKDSKEAREKRAASVVALALVAAFALSWLLYHNQQEDPPGPNYQRTNSGNGVVPTPPVPASSGDLSHTITRGQSYGCTDRAEYERLMGYVTDQDKAAFLSALAEAIAGGECTTFRAGEKVFLADTAILSGVVKLRRAGETAEYWTAMEAIH